MRESDGQSGSLFSYVDFESRVGPTHPLRTIRVRSAVCVDGRVCVVLSIASWPPINDAGAVAPGEGMSRLLLKL